LDEIGIRIGATVSLDELQLAQSRAETWKKLMLIGLQCFLPTFPHFAPNECNVIVRKSGDLHHLQRPLPIALCFRRLRAAVAPYLSLTT